MRTILELFKLWISYCWKQGEAWAACDIAHEYDDSNDWRNP